MDDAEKALRFAEQQHKDGYAAGWDACMVHLGVELNVVSKANLSDALGAALRATGRAVVKVKTVTAAGQTSPKS